MQKTNVLVVDGSVVFRAHLRKVINRQDDLKTVGIAPDAPTARKMIATLQPDVIALDLELPKMCGLAFLEEIMRDHPTPVLVIASPTMQTPEIRRRALELGAFDFIAKPRMDVRTHLREHDAEIFARLREAARSGVPHPAPVAPPAFAASPTSPVVAPRAPVAPPPPAPATPPVAAAPPPSPPRPSLAAAGNRLLVFGASAGGTGALKEVLVQLPPDCPGIVIAQHMPEHFTQTFATRLDDLCLIKVKEAEHGDLIQPGHAYLAPGDAHLLIARSGSGYVCELSQAEPVNRHRPSVDVLFRSAARAAGRHAIGVIFTGMGKDGAAGMREMHDAGAYTIAQDEASCKVFGMPREAIAQGGVDRILPLQDIARHLLDYLEKPARPAPARSGRDSESPMQ